MTRPTENLVVVGVDGSASSMGAAMWAAAEAQRRGATLKLVEAYDVSVGFAGPGMMIPPNIYEDVREYAETVLAGVRRAVAAKHPDLSIISQLRRDLPYLALRTASAHALLTVVGSHGGSEVAESLLGSIAQRVAARAASPVVVIRTDPETGETRDHGPVWVGLDGSPNSEDALAFAFEEASLRGAPLVAIHSWDGDAADGFLRSALPNEDRSLFEDEQRLLAEQLAGWSAKYSDVAVTPLVVRGRPAATLLRRFVECDDTSKPALIVVGSRGHGGFTGLLLGSTSQALIAHAACPVAVVRPSGVH